MRESKLGFVILGCGMIGSHHAAVISAIIRKQASWQRPIPFWNESGSLHNSRSRCRPHNADPVGT